MRLADDLKKKKLKSFRVAESKAYDEGLQKELVILSD